MLPGVVEMGPWLSVKEWGVMKAGKALVALLGSTKLGWAGGGILGRGLCNCLLPWLAIVCPVGHSNIGGRDAPYPGLPLLNKWGWGVSGWGWAARGWGDPHHPGLGRYVLGVIGDATP